MPAAKKPDANIQDILIVEKLDDIRLIMSEKHNRILKLVAEKEMSISEIAKALHVNPGSAFYRLKELEDHGLVRQVREEIKGGIIKKYYRATAKRIVLESPRFDSRDSQAEDPEPAHIDRLIRAIEYLGYHLPPESREDAEELLRRYEKRMRSLMIEMQQTGLENVETNGFILDTTFQLVRDVRARTDPELNRLYDEFDKLFMKYE